MRKSLGRLTDRIMRCRVAIDVAINIICAERGCNHASCGMGGWISILETSIMHQGSVSDSMLVASLRASTTALEEGATAVKRAPVAALVGWRLDIVFGCSGSCIESRSEWGLLVFLSNAFLRYDNGIHARSSDKVDEIPWVASSLRVILQH